ncbi:MAG: TonB-dependent receptor, partial [Gammaproteobacteria bacterium]|nr:TonB-dependent receptor [Gammaproteobacteria bacterium]
HMEGHSEACMSNPVPRSRILGLAVAAALCGISGVAFSQEPRVEEISVVGQFVPDEKRETASVSNVVGSEQFTRSGDSNIAESLKRVAGLSTVGGKFVYVRGLGERYSTTLLNGAILPSPEPINRVVPMDLFPTAVLESVLVQKTYSAQFPSEFGGGVLQLRTKKSIDEFFWNVSSSVGMTTEVNFKEGMTIPGGDLAWLGYDDGYRRIPEALRSATEGDRELRRASRFSGNGGYSSAELQSIGQSLRNEYLPRYEDLPANFDFSTSLGNFHEIGNTGATINYLAAVDYSNSWDQNEIERKTYKVNNEGLALDDDLVWNGTEHSIDISGIFTTGIDFNANHNIRLTSVVLRKTDDSVGFVEGDIAQEAYIRRTELEWIERELFSNQLQGDHYFPEFNELVINWRYSDVKAERDSPDHRRYRYDLEGDVFRFSTRADGNVRRFSVLDDNAEDFGLDATMVFYGPGSSTITTQAGMVINEKERDSEIRRYSFFDRGRRARDRELLELSMEEIFVPDNIAPDAFELREFTRPTDNYVARNESESWYVNGEINFDDRLRLSGGVRLEDFRQSVDTFDLFRDAEVNARQDSQDVLPAFSATLIQNDHQFRLAFSETLSRPDFRELSAAAFTDPITGREVVGNPNLLITSITNYDFRWEWYFGFSDYMSVGVFYKEFENPIESIIQGGATGIQTFANAASGENQGIEVEAYKSLDFLGGIGEDIYLQANVSFIDSSVEISEENRGIVTNLSRPLQGQSDWLFNFQAGYEPFTGTTATLLYHYFGERITEVGIEGAPDLYEQPFGELNFNFIRELNDNWKIQIKGRNLLDERSEITQGGLISTAYNMGRQFSFQVDYTF